MSKIMDFNNSKNNFHKKIYINKRFINLDNRFNSDMINYILDKDFIDLDEYEITEFFNLERLVYERVQSSEFRDRIQFRLDLLERFGRTFNFFDNGIKGRIKDYTIEVKIGDKIIEYNCYNKDVISNGKLYMMGNGTYINYYEETFTNIYSLLNGDKKVLRTINKTSSLYDKKGFEMINKYVIMHEKYNINMHNNLKVINNDKFNKEEINRLYRKDNKVLRKYNLTYLNKKYIINNGEFLFDKDLINKEEYFIAENINKSHKRLSHDLYYQEIEYGDFEKLKRLK